MDLDALFSEIRAFHDDGHYERGSGAFAELCRKIVTKKPQSFSHLVHYTTLETLLRILGLSPETNLRIVPNATDLPSEPDKQYSDFLRIYDTAYSNDPNEGDFFVNSLSDDDNFRNTYNGIWELFQRRSRIPAYLASLVTVEKWQHADDLVFWRTYGRNGAGCALLFPRHCFEDVQHLYSVQYGESDVRHCLQTLHEMFEHYATITGAVDLKEIGSAEQLDPNLQNALSPLVYLYKAKAYDFEKESRIIVPFSDMSPHPLNYQLSTAAWSQPRWRHFAELPDLNSRKLLGSGSKIILGPTMNSAANVKFVLQQILPHLGYKGHEVRTSTISYRVS